MWRDFPSSLLHILCLFNITPLVILRLLFIPATVAYRIVLTLKVQSCKFASERAICPKRSGNDPRFPQQVRAVSESILT